mgnify:CR=1 FL=1
MSRGKRYEGEPKLNIKKVFAVLIACLLYTSDAADD